MKRYIQQELQLMFHSKRWLWLAALYLLFMLLPVRQDLQLASVSSNNLAYYMTISFNHSEIFVVLCSIVALMVGDVFSRDGRERIAKLVYCRLGIVKYILSKYLIAILGAIIFLFLVNLAYLLILWPVAPLKGSNFQNITQTLSSGRLIQVLPPFVFYLQLFFKKSLESLIYIYPCLLISLFTTQRLMVYIMPMIFHLLLKIIRLWDFIPYQWRIGTIYSVHNYLELSQNEGAYFSRGPIMAIGIYVGVFMIISLFYIGISVYLVRYHREELE